MGSDEELPNIISELYAAALEPSRWNQVLSLLSKAFDAQGATFWALESSATPTHPSFLQYNFDPSSIREYLNMAAEDPTVQYLIANPNLAIVPDGMYLTDRDIDQSPYYNWQRQYTDARYRITAQINYSTRLQAGVTLHRAKAKGRFETNDVEKCSLLFPHLKNALLIGCQLESIGEKQKGIADVLDQSQSGIILLDRNGQVMYMNRRASAFISRSDGIELSQHAFSLTRSDDNHKLSYLVAQALGKTSDNVVAGGAMTTPRALNKGRYYILVTPISADQMSFLARPAAVCLSINDPAERCSLNSATLRTLFGLTEAEALLAKALAEGVELKEAAELLEISYGTARTRLADIFTKTSTKRQTELVQLLFNSTRIT